MDNYYNETIRSLEEELNRLTLEIQSTLSFYELCIDIVIKKLVKLKTFAQKNGFKNSSQEILFFKVQKPSIVSKLIYYNAIYKIEAKLPYGGKQVKENYYNEQMLDLKRFYDKNIELYKYYRTNSTHLDHKYFLRGEYDIKLSLDTYYFETDHSFATSHDYKFAKIIANDLIQLYLEKQLFNLNCDDESVIYQKHFDPVHWTANKTDLIELIYALHTHSSLNNGNMDIKTISSYFEYVFNIELGDFYHTYLELKNRKKNPTKFLDSLRDGLIRKMDDHD